MRSSKFSLTLSYAVLASSACGAEDAVVTLPTDTDADAGAASHGTLGDGGLACTANQPGCSCPVAGETAACWTGPADTRGQAGCKDGVTTCQRGAEFGSWGPCVGEVLTCAGAQSEAGSSSPASLGECGPIGTNFGGNCVVTSQGRVKCWGYVPLGSANYVVREIDGISDVRCLSGGEDFMCALTHAGRVVCWTFYPEGDAGPSTAPTVVPGLASGVVALAVGEEHACVQTASGEVSCWGTGAEQEPQIHYPPTPTKVEGLPANVASIAAGDGFSCALASTGGVKCWGGNKFGELGDGTTTDRATPVDVIGLPGPVTELSIHGASHACALLSSGGVWCWGAMTSTMSPNATPKEVRGMRASPKWLTTGGEWGGSCALSTDGAVQCWGDWTQDSGDAGTDTPRDIVGFDARVLTLASGDLHICAMLTSGAVACWGDNTFGQLGRAPQAGAYSAVPVLVNGL